MAENKETFIKVRTASENEQSTDDIPQEKETYSLGKYEVFSSESTQGVPERGWKCTGQVEGLADAFTGHTFNGEVDWRDSGICLASPDNTEMSVTFIAPEHLLKAE